MLVRSLLLALTALAVAVPSAQATAFGDALVPVHDAEDGVTMGRGGDVPFLRFGPKASKLYRRIAGKRTVVACGRVTTTSIDGTPFSTSGYGASTIKLPRKRSRVYLLDSSGDAEICTLSTRRAKNDRSCLPNSSDEKNYCARVVFPVTDAGRKRLDELARTVELLAVLLWIGFAEEGKPVLAQLQRALGGDVVELAEPEAPVPAGKVGFWRQGEELVIAAPLHDGTRRFVSYRAGVRSTNDPAFMGPDDASLAIFG